MVGVDISEIMKVYIAGLFDGEGSIVAMFSNGYPSCKVQICQKDKALLQIVCDTLNLKPTIYRHGAGKKGAYTLSLAGATDQLRFLTAIEPYVIQKADEVRIAIQISTLMQPNGSKKLDIKTLYIRDKLVEKLINTADERRKTIDEEFEENPTKRGQ